MRARWSLLPLVLLGCVESRFDNPADPQNQASNCAFPGVGVGRCCSMGGQTGARGVCVEGLCTDGTRKVVDPDCGEPPAPPPQFGAGGGGGSDDVLGDRCAFNGVAGTCALVVSCRGRSVPGVCAAGDDVGCCLPPPDAGIAPDPCGEPLVQGAECAPGNDCCGAGLGCLAGLERCVRECDANADPTGCAARALCAPDQPPVEGAPAPGLCVPGDDCQPGDEAAVCGGPATCFAVPPASFCLPGGSREVGEACQITTDAEAPESNCRAGLVCVFGVCHPPCAGGCPEGRRCVGLSHRLDDLTFEFCVDDCDLFDQDCPSGACSLLEQDDQGGVIARCVDAVQGAGVQNEPCRQSERYWGSCTAGHLCAPLATGQAPRCVGLCEADDTALCVAGSACALGALPGFDFGLCLGECRVFGDDCGPGEYCEFSFLGADDTLSGLCVVGPQTQGTNEACQVVDEATQATDCQSGHVCAATEEGQPARCIRLCDVRENDCPAGSNCATGLFGEPPNPNVGVCLGRR